MKKLLVMILSAGFLWVCGSPAVQAETWKEFLRLKKRAETPRLIPKGGIKPRLLSKDVIVESVKNNGKMDLTSESLLFEYGLPKLRDIAQNDTNIRTIAKAINELKRDYPHYYVDGHTCDIGSDRMNCRLSWARARAVRDRLLQEGIASEALELRGFGENYHAHDNSSESSRKLNRRVVLIAYGTAQGENPRKDLAVVPSNSRPGAGSPGAGPSGTSEAKAEKERHMCEDTGGDSYGSGSSTSSSSSSRRSEDPAEIDKEDLNFPGDYRESDKFQAAANELRRMAAEARRDGDYNKADQFDEKAKEIENISWDVLEGKGSKMRGRKRPSGVPAGFRPLNERTRSVTVKGRKERTTKPKSGQSIPKGFKQMK